MVAFTNFNEETVGKYARDSEAVIEANSDFSELI